MTVYQARNGLEALEEYEVEHVPGDIIVNANESNWGLPAEVQSKLAEAVREFAFNRYPPIKAETLCGLIASDLGVAAGNVQIGNGSSELLQMACYAFGGSGRKIAFPYPSFSMYGVYAQLADSSAAPYNLTEDSYIDPEQVIAFCKREQPALLIVCNPNNPTGNYNSLAQMEKILANVDCPVIMDEAYMEFAEGEEAVFKGSTLSLLNKYQNFLCMRTFSKAYGLAAMRVGYVVGDRGLMSILGKVLLPYHVNAFSLVAAQIVYEQKALYNARTALVISEREKMRAGLTELGFKIWDSATNFLLFRAEGELAEKLSAYAESDASQAKKLSKEGLAGATVYRYLLANKILARDFTRHPVLTGCIRLTIGTAKENAIILRTIKELCEKAGGK